jgi:hypothetical protein
MWLMWLIRGMFAGKNEAIFTFAKTILSNGS